MLNLHALLDVCPHMIKEARAYELLCLKQDFPRVSHQGNLHMLDDSGKKGLLLRLCKLDALCKFSQNISFFWNNA